MRFSIEDWTLRVLEEGLPDRVDQIAPGQTVPVARWIREGYGAVLFVRQWKNGQWDSDCAVTAADSTGRWHHPGSYGGGGWLNPLERPEHGWDKNPVLWITWGGGPSPVDDKFIRTIDGMAARQVAAIEFRSMSGDIYQVVQVESPYGAVVVGFTDDETYISTPLDRQGKPFRKEDGEIMRQILKAG